MRESSGAEAVRQHALVLAREGVETYRAIPQILHDCGGELESIVRARWSLARSRADDTDPLITLALKYLDEIINRYPWT